jgi:uncharacterized protein
MRHLHRLLPSRDSLRHSRWLRWLGPALFDPALWRLRRRSLALGVAIGTFFGLLIPLGQIPLSAGAAVLLRANIPSAIAATFVSNPVTFGPLYYTAWRLGVTMLGETADTPASGPPPLAAPDADPGPHESWWQATQRRASGLGRPLLLGIAVMSAACSVLAYYAVLWIWATQTWIARRFQTHQARRAAKRARRPAQTGPGD